MQPLCDYLRHNNTCAATRAPSKVADLTNSAGLWALIRWSDHGEEAVRGGRYRFLSPVWSRDDCQAVAGNRLRPVRLLNAAVTNAPNLNGLRPLSNRTPSATPQEPAMNDAVKIRLIEFLNRAQEMRATTGMSFLAAFRAASR